MNLNNLIAILKSQPSDRWARFDTGEWPGHLASWRGDYSKLTLTRDGSEGVTCGELLKDAEAAIGGKVFEGYKGGDYTMTGWTAVWADEWGDCDYNGILSTHVDDSQLVFVTADVSDYA